MSKQESAKTNPTAAQLTGKGNDTMNVAADMKSGKTVRKLHTTNPKIFRLREMNRNYKLRPSKALKAILEKELDLDQHSMETYRDFGAEHDNGLLNKQNEFGPINNNKINQNIMKFQESEQFKGIKQQCARAARMGLLAPRQRGQVDETPTAMA